MAKKIDPAKAKAKRQKTIAIVGGVVLLALLAFQLPRTMKMLKSPGNVTTSSSTTTASSTTPGSTPLAPPTLDGGSSTGAATGGGGGSSGATSADGVRDPDTPLPADAGQLVSFSRFKSKDPFKQQVSQCGATPCGTSPSSSAGAATAPPTVTTSGGGSSSGSGSPGTPKPKPPVIKTAPAAPVSSAVISVNGTAETVSVGKTFPAADPIFVLLKATATYVTVSISGGSLQSGAPSVRIAKGKSATLQNTADGTEYVLKLVSTS
jgi:hypothetical protein